MPISPNKRIFLNIVATYGRSLFALVCGLFLARWVLEALGQEDFGLYGVVGGLVTFISIIYLAINGSDNLCDGQATSLNVEIRKERF